jgi:hypothetical protein
MSSIESIMLKHTTSCLSNLILKEKSITSSINFWTLASIVSLSSNQSWSWLLSSIFFRSHSRTWSSFKWNIAFIVEKIITWRTSVEISTHIWNEIAINQIEKINQIETIEITSEEEKTTTTTTTTTTIVVWRRRRWEISQVVHRHVLRNAVDNERHVCLNNLLNFE